MKLFKKQRATKESAGYDIPVLKGGAVKPHETYVFETDANFEIKEDEVALIISRSSLGFNKNLMLVNSVGVIDSDFYPNTIKIKVYNFGSETVIIDDGERLAQALIFKYSKLNGELEPLKKRTGGFGSTGKK